jgi:hypothetical protein
MGYCNYEVEVPFTGNFSAKGSTIIHFPFFQIYHPSPNKPRSVLGPVLASELSFVYDASIG